MSDHYHTIILGTKYGTYTGDFENSVMAAIEEISNDVGTIQAIPRVSKEFKDGKYGIIEGNSYIFAVNDWDTWDASILQGQAIKTQLENKGLLEDFIRITSYDEMNNITYDYHQK